MAKEIKRRIFSIIYIVVLVSVLTFFIFGPRKQFVYASINIKNSKIDNKSIIIHSNDTLKLDKKSYNFSVRSKKNTEVEYELLLVNNYRKSILKDCKVLSNNNLKYSITDEDNYNINGNVRIDGIIYKDILKPYEIKKLSLKLWIDEEKNKDTCYYPILKIEEKLV